MADEREPPPLFGDEIDDKDDSEDLFSPSVESKPIVPPVVNKVNTTRPQDIDDDKEDIFADADTEVPLDDSPTEIVPEKQAPATLPTLETAPTKEPSPEPVKLFSRVGDSLNKMTFKMDETDQWFEEKQQHIEQLDLQLHKLHASIEALVQLRKELAQSTGLFAKSCAMLGNAEEHTALSRALSQLAEVEERVDQVHMDQADADFFVFSELLKDYIALTAAVKDIFHERVKLFKMWKEAEATLTKRRENKVKFELANKQDKVAQAQQEITEGEERVEKCQEQFEKISRNIRDELGRFEKQRIKDFKSTIINYLESLMNSEQQVIKYWETFLPEAKAIA